MIYIDKTEELIYKALSIGEKYRQADKPTKIEVGKLMTSNRRIKGKRYKKKKKLIDTTNTYKQGAIHRINP